MESFTSCGIVLLAVSLALGLGCSRQTGLAADASSDSQKLPFNRQSPATGVSPSHSLIPSATRLSEGTPLTICLQRSLSSASANAGDSVTATLDAPVVVDGQTLVARGAAVSGRVLEAKHSSGPHDPGYLRIALVSLTVGEKPFPIETNSVFAKGGVREDSSSTTQKEIVLGPERRLNFRLAKNVDLQ